MHIGFVTIESPYDSNACGIAAYLRAMIPALVSEGNRVSVFANAKETKTFEPEDGVTVHHFQLPSTHWYASKVPGLRSLVTLPLRQLEWSASFYRHVSKASRHDKLDLIECSETGALFLNRLAPLVVRLHGSEVSFRRYSAQSINASVRWNDALEAVAAKRASAITAPSLFQANEAIRRRGWAGDRVRVISNPLAPSMLQAALRNERRPEAEPIILYTGRLAPVKGIETLLTAATLVHQQNRAVTFVLAGPWQMPKPPEAYGLQLRRKSDAGILWVGAQDQSQLIDWYQRASLFVMPSHYESFGISVVEAMAFGLPVVCTNAGALTELVEDGVTGNTVPPGNSKVLAHRILESLQHSIKQNGMRDAARAKVLNNFTVDPIVSAALRVYAGVLSGAGVRLSNFEGAISSSVQ